MAVRGVVNKVFSKDFDNKTLYSFTLQGDRNFYGTGERKAPVEVGKAYEFETRTTPSGRINVDLGTLRPWEDGPTLQAPPVQNFARRTSGGFKGDPDKDAYWKNKEARDIQNDKMRELGATRNTAIALMQVMLANGAVKLPAKENAKEAALYALFEHYTDTLLKGKQAEADAVPEEKEDPAVAEGEPEWK